MGRADQSPAGDTFVREIDVSRITLRLTTNPDNRSDEKDEHVIAKLTGDTLGTLKQCLVRNMTSACLLCILIGPLTLQTVRTRPPS